MRYTYLGDANLDGSINSDDLSLLALTMAQEQAAQQNNQSPPTVFWYNGDFNYNSTVDADDFLLMSLGSAVQGQQVLGRNSSKLSCLQRVTVHILLNGVNLTFDAHPQIFFKMG